jgi:hypothetical protein
MAATVVSETKTAWILETGATPVLRQRYGVSVFPAAILQPPNIFFVSILGGTPSNESVMHCHRPNKL